MDEKVKDVCDQIEINRLKFFPIMMFAIVMGLAGLTIVFQKSQEILGFGGIVGDILVMLVSIIFIVISLVYIIKIIKYLPAVKKEFAHPIRINFFPASAISLLLLSVVYHHINHDISFYSFLLGAIMQTFFTFYTISFWINQNLELHHSNPAWFIPIVGNVLVPVAGAGLIDTNILMYYFAVGMFFWIILTAILINRIIFHHQLAAKFMPTLFIFIAPPAIGFIAYVKMNGGDFDLFASFLYNLALFFTFLIFFMYKNFMGLKFFISWWAFTFPLTAVTIASMLAYKLTHIVLYKYFAYLFMLVACIVILLVAITTIRNMFKGKVCIQE
ncbi:MAG: SLAC1 anion channel family protein [Arcobacteraceae bacterium]|nr:SLAC1 anion channel family protein [Arcobacteraceae bacterium]